MAIVKLEYSRPTRTEETRESRKRMQAVSQLVDSYALTLGYERTSDELWRVIDEVPLDCVFDTLSERLAAMVMNEATGVGG